MAIPPVEALLDVSESLLQDIELASRNRAANLSKELKAILDLWIAQMVAADVALYMRENRKEILQRCSVNITPKKVDFFDSRDVKKSA